LGAGGAFTATAERPHVSTSARQHAFAALVTLAVALPAHALTFHNGMVAAEHQLASQAGVRILKAGGNAVDAAVATSLAVGVANPTSCGIGGGGFMLIYDHATSRVAALDYRETAPAAASRDMFIRDGKAVPELSLHTGLAVATPGEIAGLFAALRRYGTKSFAEVAAPAISLARDGFPVEAHLADSIARNAELIRARPALAALLFRPDGTPLVAGDTLRQPQLAATLERIVAQGPAAFYAGDTAAAMADSVQAAGGVLTRRDLAAYRPVWRRPVSAPFDGYTFFGMPPPSSGGGVMIEALNIMRADDLRALEQNSATYLHLLTESLQFAFADRAEFYGDPDVVRVPLATLTSPARGRDQRARISAPTTFSPQWYGTGAVESDHGTSHLSIVDGAGNAVACTTSINTAFGSMVVAGDTGIILNDTMDDFSAQPGVPNVFGLIGSEANAIAPGKRPLSSMSPTIVTRGGQVAAVAGGSGGPLIITGTMQALLNALVFGQDAMEAVSAARLHHQWTPPVLMVEPGIDGGTRQALVGLGHKVIDAPGAASVQLVLRAPDGTLDGASDPRKGGKAAGW
jgi:gamma-glutamyltranspeptidase/glutathione hydrolase